MISVILLMAGSGSRMKIQDNKVFLPLENKMIFQYSLDLFLKLNCEVICVIRPEDEDKLHHYYSKIKIVYGGQTRQMSVYNGLKQASCNSVLIHDAARPFISEELIKECIKTLNEKNAVLVGCKTKDSIYEIEPLKSLNREKLFNAQTPQGASRTILLKCHEKALNENIQVTDDISLILKYTDPKK